MNITGRLEQESGLLVDRIDQAANALGSVADESKLKLDEAHRKFGRHVETANTYLADQLATAAGELDNKLKSISMQLTGKLELTGTRMSERLDDVSTLVERSVEKFNTEMEQMLTSRRDSLDSLIKDATTRSQDIDSVMTSYLSMIEQSLAAAEDRSKEIGRIVSEQTATSLGKLEEELKRLETSSSQQVVQAARVLREQHERALSSMNEMLASTATDFQQTAQDMRLTAQQVVKEIDTSRAELRRAVIDLPEETRTNADQMRRVVADQIAALNALAETVRRQSGSVDVSLPAGNYRSAVTSAGKPPGKSESAPFSAPPFGTQGARKPNPERTAEPSVNARMADIAAAIRSSAEVPSTPVLSQQQQRVIDDAMEKLNAASRDIVDALDGGLPRDLEKRFTASQTGVYVDRLADGAKRLQKVIEKRVPIERLLKARVNAYIRIFERMLDALSIEGGSGNPVLDDVLSSEHGQVYLMLAQATGRVPD